MDTERDLGDVLPLPEVHCLKHLVDRDAILFSGFLETLNVLHERKPASFLVDLLDASGHQFVHQTENVRKEYYNTNFIPAFQRKKGKREREGRYKVDRGLTLQKYMYMYVRGDLINKRRKERQVVGREGEKNGDN